MKYVRDVADHLRRITARITLHVRFIEFIYPERQSTKTYVNCILVYFVCIIGPTTLREPSVELFPTISCANSFSFYFHSIKPSNLRLHKTPLSCRFIIQQTLWRLAILYSCYMSCPAEPSQILVIDRSLEIT